MILENKICIKVKREEREYTFEFMNNSNLGELYSAWSEIGDYLAEKIREDQKAREAKEETCPIPLE